MKTASHATNVSPMKLLLILSLALFGYAILLSFPALTIYSLITLPSVFSAHTLDITMAGVYSGLVALGIAISYHTFTIKFDDHIGIPLPRKKAPKLYEYLDQHCADAGLFCGKIHQVQLSERHEIKLIKVPVLGIPLWTKNVLVIGLSHMQTLSKTSFEKTLTSTASQLILTKHPLLHWLASLHYVWEQYPVALRTRNKIGDVFLADFFSLLSRIYKRWTLPLVRKARLAGDKYNHTIHNHRDHLESIQAEMAAEVYMRHYHWPHILKTLYNNEGRLPEGMRLYAGLPNAIEQKLGAEKLTEIFTNLYEHPDFGSPCTAPLRQRIHQIGYDKMNKLKPWMGDAAIHYIEKDYPLFVEQMEQRWLGKYSRSKNAMQHTMPKSKPSSKSPTTQPAAQAS